jgi:LAO/AO transport system kinase
MGSKDIDKKGQERLASQAARNRALARIRSAHETRLTPEDWATRILEGNRDALGQAITLAESHRLGDLEMLTRIFDCIENQQATPSVAAHRIGITGVPGVGKSTFIEAFGQLLIGRGHRVAVLAIDPSSARSGGSLLGDKTRMVKLTSEPNAYVRPSPTASHLGGVAKGTHEAILLCEAAGFDRILVETVGVGQSETEVRNLTDVFALLMLPGGGDELQGIKRGIMEMADLLIVNKDDGPNRPLARETASAYQQAVRLFPPNPGGHVVNVHTASALQNDGIESIANAVEKLVADWQSGAWFTEQRSAQQLHHLERHLNTLTRIQQWNSPAASEAAWNSLQAQVASGGLHPLAAAQQWLNIQRAS